MAHDHGPEGDHEHAHDHDHGHQHGHDHEHGHDHGTFGWRHEMIPFLHGHSHGATNVDAALEGSERGLWALKVSLLVLGLTAAFQLIVFFIGSTALLPATIHNPSADLTAIPPGSTVV